MLDHLFPAVPALSSGQAWSVTQQRNTQEVRHSISISDDTVTDTYTDTQEDLHLIYGRQRQMSVEKTKLYLLLEILRNWLNRAKSILLSQSCNRTPVKPGHSPHNKCKLFNNQVFFTQCKETGIFGLSRIFALSFCEAWMVAETQIKASWICSLWNFCRSFAGLPCYVFVFYVNKQINGNGDCCHSSRSELQGRAPGHSHGRKSAAEYRSLFVLCSSPLELTIH